MAWNSLAFSQWVDRANLQDAVTNYGLTLKSGQTIPFSNSNKIVKKSELTTWTNADTSNGYLSVKSNDQFVALRDITMPSPTFIDAEFIVFTYNFPLGAGQDLDTQTSIISPSSSGPIGYCQRGSPNADISTSDGYLHWGGDNTGTSGTENIYVDVKALKTAYPTMTDVEILCRANWFTNAGNGVIGIEMRAYKGPGTGTTATMVHDGNYGYYCTGFTSSSTHSFPPATVTLVYNGCRPGGSPPVTQCIGIFTYNLAAGTFTQNTTCTVQNNLQVGYASFDHTIIANVTGILGFDFASSNTSNDYYAHRSGFKAPIVVTTNNTTGFSVGSRVNVYVGPSSIYPLSNPLVWNQTIAANSTYTSPTITANVGDYMYIEFADD
jgi:hypothetical protein